MSQRETPAPLEANEKRKRKREYVAIVVLLIAFAVATFVELRLSGSSSQIPFINSIFFFGLLNINLVIFGTLCWLVFRNIGKLFIERRRNILGSKLKTRLVIAFFSFSIIPTLVLFLISAAYINSSFDKWFSLKIQNTLEASLEITRTYYKNAGNTAIHFAEHIAKGAARKVGRPKAGELQTYLNDQRELLALDSVELYTDPLEERIISSRPKLGTFDVEFPRLPLEVLKKAFAGEPMIHVQFVGNGDLVRALVPIEDNGQFRPGVKDVAGVLAVSTYVPVSLNSKVDEIANVFDDYKTTNPLKYPMKSMYLILLVTITLVIIFLAIWIALYLARELTVPLQRLVHGAQAVGSGNLDITVMGGGRQDEIAVLVESFNKMTRDLRNASQDMEKRRKQLEAILANVGTGVLVVERSGELTIINRAASQLLGLEPKNVLGKPYTEVLREEGEPLAQLISRSLDDLSELASLPDLTQLSYSTRTLAVILTQLSDAQGAAPWGVVVVIDDMTHLIKGQREMAWREVARRIAHEIKNPLTPIKLSAQRLQRRLGSYSDRDAMLLKECTDTIIKHTDELKEMVNEFSNFARFPEISPSKNSLNQAVQEVISLYESAHPEVRFEFKPEKNLPEFDFDRDQMKRVVINLLENSVSALTEGKSPNPSIEVETHYNEPLQMAVAVVRDNGPGMDEEVRDRVFEPYFSTKAQGSGLGLAITKRIVNDHDGFIRVHSQQGQGTVFQVELPTSARKQNRS